MFSRSYHFATGVIRIKVRDFQLLPITVRPSIPGAALGEVYPGGSYSRTRVTPVNPP